MYEPLINTATPAAELHKGFPDSIDQLAGEGDASRSFLRAAWYRAGADGTGADGTGRTLIGRNAGGAIIAAIPTIRAKPALPGIRSVPGCYYPFRSALVADGVLVEELAQLFAQKPAAKALGPVWRMGPAPVDAPATRTITRAAALAGWTVLQRAVGTTWLFDLANGGGLPGRSTAKRLRQYERKLAAQGKVTWRRVSGSDWDEATLDQLGAIERQSWVGRETGGKGMNFFHPHQRELWRAALTDPHIAQFAEATILALDERPIAFSFDLVCGTTQHAIACSFVEDMGSFRVGNLVTHNQLQHARERGVATVDLGAGDLGYKRQMGAIEGEDYVDLLFVRRRTIATLLALKWGPEPSNLKTIRQSGIAPEAG